MAVAPLGFKDLGNKLSLGTEETAGERGQLGRQATPVTSSSGSWDPVP